ncbi:MAG TPA: type II toxin-antitoxin system RelE/ParE family toxin [Devosia sp.]|nr:type II toxin-antitoxin system RelE/ParE family toxin [Devosia sp.]
MAKVRFTPRALEQLGDIWQFIAEDNEAAADKLYWRMREHIALAAENPGIGVERIPTKQGIRSLVVGAYLIFYEQEPGGIVVLAVVHGMREPKSWLD